MLRRESVCVSVGGLMGGWAGGFLSQRNRVDMCEARGWGCVGARVREIVHPFACRARSYM